MIAVLNYQIYIYSIYIIAAKCDGKIVQPIKHEILSCGARCIFRGHHKDSHTNTKVVYRVAPELKRLVVFSFGLDQANNIFPEFSG